MSRAPPTAAPIATAVKPDGDDAPLSFGAWYLERLRCKQTRRGTMLRTVIGLALAVGGVAAVRWDRDRQFEAGRRVGQLDGYGGEGGDP